jgi:hypothetical protein
MQVIQATIPHLRPLPLTKEEEEKENVQGGCRRAKHMLPFLQS